MSLEQILPNRNLVPATIISSVKYLSSGLKMVKLSDDQFSIIENATLNVSSGNPYPLVSGKDLYGRDIVVPLTIKGKTDQIYLPEAVVNISRERNIVATPVLNGKGTVKEMITDGDLSLSISVAIMSNSDDGKYDENLSVFNDLYPYKGVERFRQLLEEPNRLDIVSDFLKLFDLDGGDLGIVVKSYSVNQETHLNRQVFEIQAISDYDYNLLIEE
jgi:hypothetical protein